MGSWVIIILMGAIYTCSKVPVLGDIYIAELVVEGNFTLNAQSILPILNTIQLQVNDSNGVNYTVTFLQNELTAECLFIGSDSICSCSTGFAWSNNVCYNHNCCNDTTCTANMFNITPLCVPEVNVQISGSVELISDTWNETKTAQLQTTLQGLNGFQCLNLTQRGNVNDFQITVNVRVNTSRLQEIFNTLKQTLNATITAKTTGMVTIESPNASVCYNSSPVLTCTFDEMANLVDWNLIQNNQSTELYPGSIVKLNNTCGTTGYDSCTKLTLQQVTGTWVGIYECGFTAGSVSHTARAQLDISLLPDLITVETEPITADCSQKTTQCVQTNISTTILQSKEQYEVWLLYNNESIPPSFNTSSNGSLVYIFNASISCKKAPVAQNVNVTFKNTKGQQRSGALEILVIYAGNISCSENSTGEDFWPKTPAGGTVINRTCDVGRVGYKSRTCNGPDWQPVFDYCISQELNILLNQADEFLKGLGATQEKAKNIFQKLNSSTSALNQNIADIYASINILSLMADASKNTVLQEEILPDFINAASNVVDKTWDAANTTVLHEMSSSYLNSVEDLLQNINVTTNNGVISKNLNFTLCSSSTCSVSVFDVLVNMEITYGKLKTVAVKNLMDRLNNGYNDTEPPTNLLLMATLQDNNDLSSEIKLRFPNDRQIKNEALCVFWNTTIKDWSNVGCKVSSNDRNHIFCECSHLTSFSALMSKDPKHNPLLDMITNVGLGVSICSLLTFLIIESVVWSAVVKTNLAYFRHTAVVNIAIFLLLANISFLASTSPDILSDNMCLILTICKHLFYLAMFFWMLCLSIMLVHQLIFVFSPLRKKIFIIFSSIVGYVCPILIVASSYVYYKFTNKPYNDSRTCWLVFESLLVGSVHAFLLPVGTVIFTNLFCMTVIIVTLVNSSAQDTNKTDDRVRAKGILKVLAILTPLFGITWIIGFFQYMLDKNDVVEMCFILLNSFQGVFFLITGCFTEHKVREELYKRIMGKPKEKPESTKNLISAACSK